MMNGHTSGNVIWRNICQTLAPSRIAASYGSCGRLAMPPSTISITSEVHCQVSTMISVGITVAAAVYPTRWRQAHRGSAGSSKPQVAGGTSSSRPAQSQRVLPSSAARRTCGPTPRQLEFRGEAHRRPHAQSRTPIVVPAVNQMVRMIAHRKRSSRQHLCVVRQANERDVASVTFQSCSDMKDREDPREQDPSSHDRPPREPRRPNSAGRRQARARRAPSGWLRSCYSSVGPPVRRGL